MSVAHRTQEQRALAIETPAGADRLLLLSMHGGEALGRLFEYELNLMAEVVPVEHQAILGKNVTVRLERHGGKTRHFNGYISRYTLMSVEEANRDHQRLYYYRATLVPWTWFLTRTATCRIFQNMTIPAIIEKVFRERGFMDFKKHMSGHYVPWEYCVQYRETDFNFISRLMEHEGIYYYFEHENGKHSLVMCDASGAHSSAPGYKDLYFDKPDLKAGHDGHVWDWTLGQEVTANRYGLTDYDPLLPKAQLETYGKVTERHDPVTYEIFDYPGGYKKADEGRRYAHIRVEEAEALHAVGHGTTSARGVYTGSTFTLQDYPGHEAEEYLITGMGYQMHSDEIGGGRGGRSGGVQFEAQITCLPAKVEYRPQRVTPKPVIQGPQTAVVVGPSGEEIYTDKYGRVKVHFFWDRESDANEKSSCWMRVAQNWGGKQWGTLFMPRVGQEVIVEFLEGDPDRPIITGRVYNGEHMPPYELPVHQTRSTIKSLSTKGGGGFNELRFEDKKGEEHVFVHAEKDMEIKVKHRRHETVGHNRHLVVKNSKLELIDNNRHEIVKKDHYEKIGGERHLTVTGKQASEISGSKSLHVKGDVAEVFDANHSEHTAKDDYLLAENIIIEGKTNITLQVGKSYIAIEKNGITIGTTGTFEVEGKSASMKTDAGFTVEASGPLSIKSSATAEFKGPKVSVEGSAMTTIKGGMVMIN